MQNSETDVMQKTNDIKTQMNTSLGSATSASNQLERKISWEEKRSVTSSNKTNSLSNIQQFNESGNSASPSSENLQQNNSINELREEDESKEMDDDESARCSIM